MGPRNSKQSQLNFMKDYTVIQQIPTQNITFLQHKKTEDQYLLKQFNFNDKKQCQKMMDKLAQLKNKLDDNKHVVPLKDYLMSSQDQYCSTFYKIYALFAYPQRTLDDQINQRKLHRKKFTQTELWSILASCIVGLSHLQKNGIKHSALKSNNILLSRQGVIKISDPFSIGQHPNYDSVFTKRSSSHIYLSPEQTQALQQQVISPVVNPFKSDIFTLGMIMLQAGLLEYQDEQCYRDQKSRIHWQTVHYNIDRLGQAYSDQIKNMVQFMLSKDQRARPDWCDLQEHVMKGGDDVRRSFIEGQNKGDKTFSNGDSFIINQGNKPVALNPNKGRISTTQGNNPVTSNQNVVPHVNIPISSQNTFGRYSPRVPSTTNTLTQPFVNSTVIGNGNQTLGRYSRPESPRVSQPTNYYNQPYVPSTLNPYNLQNPIMLPSTAIINSTTYPSSNLPSSNIPITSYSSPYYYQQPNTITSQYQTQQMSYSNIAPLKPSNIDHTRPTKNIFPSDTYINRTKFDQNLIIMTEEQQENQQNYQQGYNGQIGQQQIQNKIVNVNNYGNNNNVNNGRFRYDMVGNGTFNPRQYNDLTPQDSKDRPSSYNTTNQDPQSHFSNQNRIIKPYSQYTQNNQIQGYPQSRIQAQPQPQTYYQNFVPNTQQNKLSNQNSTNSNSQLVFVTQQFKMGSRYQGYKLNGLRHGYGKFYYQDGGMYDGDWRENKMQGYGKLFYQSGKLAYEGQWKDDQFMGKGVLFNEIPQKLDGAFNYNNFDDVQQYWTKYQGQFLDDMKNGKGILYLSNGQRLQGHFVGDSVQGPGIFYCKNGQRINGNWNGNVKVG